MSLANLSVAYQRMRAALEDVAWEQGDWPEIWHIQYCRWCSWSKDWVAKHGHGEKCPIRGGSPHPTPEKP